MPLPAGSGEGVRAHLSRRVSASRQTTSIDQPAVSPASPHATGQVYQPGLPRAAIARYCHYFLQVHIELLTGRVPTFNTTTAEMTARNFIASVFRDVELPGVLVSDRDTRFTSAFWTGLHAPLVVSLIFDSPHHNKPQAR